MEDHDDRDDELDELDPEEDEAVQRTTTRKGKGKKSASTAPPKKKARVAPAATTPPRPAAAKAVRATPARATRAVTVAARNKVVMPVRATRGKATGKGARKQSTAKTLQTLLVKVRTRLSPFPCSLTGLLQFRGKFRCAGCSRRDGSNNEVPECRVVGQAWRCFECNDGHRNCEISVSKLIGSVEQELTLRRASSMSKHSSSSTRRPGSACTSCTTARTRTRKLWRPRG